VGGKLLPSPRTIKDNRIVFGSLLPEMASMSILDDAIREHLELKRAHGADEAELKKLEDEAFGPPERPDQIDPFAEAPTEFMGVPDAPEGEEAGGRRAPNITDLQEAPESPKADAPVEAEVPETQAEPEAPAEEQQPASELAIPEPAAEDSESEPEPSHNTQERHAIVDQPTELFDVESVMESESEAPTHAPSPSDEDLVDEEMSSPRLTPVDPPAGIEATAAGAEAAEEPLLEDEEDEEDFFSEQRLSDELNQALEAPITEEHPVEEAAAPATDPELAEEEDVADEEEQQEPAPPSPEPAAEHEHHEQPADHEDVLEDTPDFLEDAPEDDNLWFEQRPPKDFDFDD
jgi:hypothetical protein